MGAMGTKVQDGGRLVVPAELRRTLGLQTGTEIVMDVVDGALRVRTVAQAIKDAQALVRRYSPAGRMASDELIAERRLEALHEDQAPLVPPADR